MSQTNSDIQKKQGPITEIEKQFCETLSGFVVQWGFKAQLGKVWALLYLRKEGLNPLQLQDCLNMSAGNINYALNELQNWGVVHKTRFEGDRKTYFKVEEQIWTSVSNVLKARELKVLDDTIKSLKDLNSQVKAANSKADPKIKYQEVQIQKVQATLQTAQRFAELAVSAPMERLVKLSTVLSTLRKM